MSSAPTLQFTAQDSYSVYGFSFVMKTNHSESRDAIVRLYHRFLRSSASETVVEAGFEAEGDGFRWRVGDKTGDGPNLGSALWAFESALCEGIIRSQRRLIAVHAATLYFRGLAVMLIGPSEAGKSTLSVAFSRRGFTLATDDVALVDPQTLNVHPIPRCLHLDGAQSCAA